MTVRDVIQQLLTMGLDTNVVFYDCTNEKYATAVSIDTEHNEPEIVMSFESRR